MDNQVSVIICTCNRHTDLKTFINSLNQQTILPYELVIIDASDNNLTYELIESLHSSVKYKVIYTRSPRGLTRQRNIGVDRSQGKYLYFFDDDIVLSSQYIEYVQQSFYRNADENIGGVVGRVNITHKKNNYYDRFKKKFFFLSTGEGTGNIKASGFPSYRSNDEEGFVEVAGGGLTAYLRDVFDELRFDETLGEYCFMEDVDFSYRVSRKWKILYQPNALLDHFYTTYKDVNSRKLRRMVIQNHSYLFQKNLPHDFYHIIAHLLSIFGLFLDNFFARDLQSSLGILEGLWFGTVKKQGPYNARLL